MLANPKITHIITVLVGGALVLVVLAMVLSSQLTEALGGTAVSMEYETKLFDTSQVIQMDIVIDPDQWADMLANATQEQYYQCDVVINGQTFYSVGIRPKGNSSLSSIAGNSDSNRYSFKMEFDQFVDGQTCWGLDKLALNNNYADSTQMKEALVYDMFQYMEVDASLYNYAEISVNGAYWGVYLAVEAVEDSFLLRNYGVKSGELYKPDSMNMNRNMENGAAPMGGDPPGDMPTGMPDFDSGNFPFAMSGEGEGMPAFGEGGEMPAMPSFASMEEEGGGWGGRGFGMGASGANLNYADDELDSYSDIWEGAVTSSSDADHRRVVTALKNISQGTDIEQYMDVDNLLRYMAVHSFVVNDDSLSGNMAHNYYLYEGNGQLNILPWDYNLSFGGMTGGFGGMGGSGGASGVINDPIDTPFDATSFFDTLLENPEYLQRYHDYYRQLVEEYVQGGVLEATYQRIRSQIDHLVTTDPNALYTYEEYIQGAEMLLTTIKLRAQSVLGQLNGTIPSTSEGQQADSSALVDATEIDISLMGSFHMNSDGQGGEMGGGFMGRGGMRPRGAQQAEVGQEGSESEAGGVLALEASGGSAGGREGLPLEGASLPENDSASGNRLGPMGSFGADAASTATTKQQNGLLYGICLAVALLAVVVFIQYRRKPPVKQQ